MRIAVPVDDKTIEAGVCPSFGRTPYFLIYDTDSTESRFIDNSASEIQGGAGIKAAQVIVDNSANVLLTPRCGKNAAEVIKAAGIGIYKTIDSTAMDNINMFGAGKLEILTDIHAGFHKHGES
ncbi:MAG TPA: NifB/NifX family molybdenum-iron cluster-binding protein [Clostridia bacterium]|nr:NifB/NifX family molybdenum-iron cluster-binding protein [Clostridia bacterium]